MITVMLQAAIAFLSVSMADFRCGGDYPVLTTQKDDGTRVGLIVPSDALSRAPTWKPEDGEPPLSISEAREAVLEWAEDQYSRFDSVEVAEITLRSSGSCSTGERWYYVFDLRPILDGNSFWGSGNWAAVLMDASVYGTQELK